MVLPVNFLIEAVGPDTLAGVVPGVHWKKKQWNALSDDGCGRLGRIRRPHPVVRDRPVIYGTFRRAVPPRNRLPG